VANVDLSNLEFKTVSHGRERIVARVGLKMTSTGLALTATLWTEWAAKYGYKNGSAVRLVSADAGSHIALMLEEGTKGEKPEFRHHGRGGKAIFTQLVQIQDIGARVYKQEWRVDEIKEANGRPVFLFEKRRRGLNVHKATAENLISVFVKFK